MYNSTSTSLFLTWDHARPYFAKNTVRGFVINVNDNRGGLIGNATVQDLPEAKNVTGLKPYSAYCMTVRPVIYGLGKESNAICAFTDESGKNELSVFCPGSGVEGTPWTRHQQPPNHPTRTHAVVLFP